MTRPVLPLRSYLDLLAGDGLLAAPLPGGLDLEAQVTLISCDSRQVVPGTLFLCKGAHFQPEFLEAARRQGAMAYCSETAYPQCPLPCILVRDMRRVMAPLADRYYGHPSGALKVVGITGTKGKSSTAYYLKHILDDYLLGQGRAESGIVSSIHTYDGVERFESHLTTPEPLDLQRHFANGVDTGMEYLTMEVSSQALKYHRTLCTEFAAACFLNIGYDHVSPVEHPDFEDYFSSKLKIFAQARISCVNLDCEHAPRILRAALDAGKPVITFSQKDPQADVYAWGVRKDGHDICFTVRTRAFTREFRLTMPGLFNVENALAAIALCQALNIPQSAVYTGLMRARVPGRMEVYANRDQSVISIVDYAHNRLSFETLFRSVRAEYPGRKVVIVFGCPGKKAYDRRRDLGEVAGRCADRVVLTEEDSGEEDTLSICREIAQSVQRQGCPVHIEPNRGEAIRQAVLGCGEPTVLLLTGKGAETRQKRGTAYIDTPSDVEYVQAFLQEYDLRRGLEGDAPLSALFTLLPALKQEEGRTLVVSCPLAAPGALAQDLSALRAAGGRIVLVCRPSGTLPQLGEQTVALRPGDGGLLRVEGAKPAVQPKLLDTLLDGGFLPVVELPPETGLSCDRAAAALAGALRAQQLVLLAEGEPSLAAGEDQQSALLHMDVKRVEELLCQGLLPRSLLDRLSLCAQAVRDGVGECAVLNGREEHMLLRHLLKQQVLGTTVTP